MSVDSIIKEDLKLDQGFPKIKVGTSGLVILFSEPAVGTVVGYTIEATPETRKAYPLGNHSESWVSQSFMDFYGVIELGNSYSEK